ncbi:MAG: putative toxin-antitoxin system toxin component, PIN family [Bacteroidales bacterium]|nr:putative toxin-antitoxin system toxin component, PIN family [Bacteroidales bacterium]
MILDTNIWIGYLISKELFWIDNFFEQNDFELLFSDRLLSEFFRVIQRPKIKKYFSKEKLYQLIDRFEDYGTMIEPKSKIQQCQDSNDDFLLELAIDGTADFLVTGDKDLLVLETIGDCKIITLKILKEIQN